MKKFLLLCLAKILVFGLPVSADQAGTDYEPKEPQKIKLDLIYFLDDSEPKYTFRIGDIGFRDLTALKNYLATLPKGSEVTWAPTCVRKGGEPLSTESELKDFSKFLAEKGIKFIQVRSG